MRMNVAAPPQTARIAVRHGSKASKLLPCCLPVLFLIVFAAGTPFAAARQPAPQPPATNAAPASPQQALHPHRRASAAHTPAPAPQAPPAPVTTPAPETPNWPMNNKPVAATVVWDSQGLRIDASNSSLEQILKDVATATGARLTGLGHDEHMAGQRVFGSYGPGTARDVLTQLLTGSGYNVLLIGDQGQGTPREIVLSARSKGDTPVAAGSPPPPNDENSDVEDQPQPQPPPALRNDFVPGQPPRNPQQLMEQMRLRQQQMQQPPNNPQQ